MAGIVFKLAFLHHAIEYAVGWLLDGLAMMATFQGDVLPAAFKKNNLTSIGPSNYIHSTYVAHQTAKWYFDSS